MLKKKNKTTVTQTTLLVRISTFIRKMFATQRITPLVEFKKMTRQCDNLPYNESCVHIGSVLT
jgi:hypothetical protein